MHIKCWVYGEFEFVLSSQQVTNLAAAFAHCCISPNRYGSLWASGVSLKSLHAFVIRGKCVFLMSSYDWQEVRKCSSVSIWLCVQREHSLSSLGSQVCPWRLFSMARLCSLSLYSLCYGSNSMPIYSGFWWTLSNVPNTFPFVCL